MSLSHLSLDAVDLWNEWQIRSLMLLSLFLQIFLSYFGKKRKVSAARWLGPSLWIAYLSADWVATFSLGILARSEAGSKNWNWIPVFWAPVLLVHLGGPGAITAYSVDRLNKLFLSRLLQLVTHVGVVCYVLFRLWSKDTITSVVISLLILGIIKYGERIWVLMRDHEDSNGSQLPDFNVPRNHLDGIKSLHDAYLLFQALETLLKNLDLVADMQKRTYDLVSVKKAKEAFQLVEVELGFKYDRLYYKVTMISRVRVILRSITFVSSIFALVSFSTKSNDVYSRNDRIISYVLLIGVVCLESYSIISHLLSDWGMIWLSRNKTVSAIVSRINYHSRLVSFSMKRKRWSRLMGQHNMIRAQSNKPVSKILKKYFPGKWNVDKRRKVNKELKELIFKQVLDKRRSRYNPSTDDFNCLQNILAERGDQVLRSKGLFPQIGWSVAEIDFIQSLLTWRIATHVCYLDDSRKNTFDKTQSGVRSSRSLSNYMMYLLVNCPTMIAIEPSEKRYADTRIHLLHLLSNTRNEVKPSIPSDASSFHKTEVKPSIPSDASSFHKTEVKPSIPSDASSFHKTEVNAFFRKMLKNPSTMLKEIGKQESVEKSALLDGCMLALSLQSLETGKGWSNGKKWEMISEVWVEMLMYAATHCRWKEHVHALSQGGELLTHVCVLMAHLGLSKQCPPVLNREVEDREKRFNGFLETVSVGEV